MCFMLKVKKRTWRVTIRQMFYMRHEETQVIKTSNRSHIQLKHVKGYNKYVKLNNICSKVQNMDK